MRKKFAGPSALVSAICFSIVVPFAEARTVALWPLAVRSDLTVDARCAINPANTLPVRTSNISAEIPAQGQNAPTWTLPPNPDPGRHIFEPYASGAAGSTVTAIARAPFSLETTIDATPHLSSALSCTNDFTIEGYVRLDGLPGDDTYNAVFESNVGGNQIFWSIRRTRKNEQGNYRLTFECYWRGAEAGQPGGDCELARVDDIEWVGTWHHIALTRTVENGNVYLEMFVDGNGYGKKKVAKITQVVNDGAKFHLGGRADKTIKAAYRYWRVSDCALAPEEFLNAPGAGGQTYATDVSETVAYWPLRVGADGKVDYSDKAGGDALQRPLNTLAQDYAGFTIARGISAFKGDPPNEAIKISDKTLAARVADGNCDSFAAWTYPSCGSFHNLNQNSRAEPNSASFTLECYYRPSLRERMSGLIPTDESVAYFITSMQDATPGNGWALQIVRDPAKGLAGGRSTWRLVYMDSQTVASDRSTYVAYGDFPGGSFIEGDDIWRHVALVYTRTGGEAGFGRWELFIDGTSCGTVDNTRNAAEKTGGDHTFLAGNAKLPGQVYGYFDCFVYSNTPLTPDYFLCTPGGKDAGNSSRKAFLTLDADTLHSPAPFASSVNDDGYFYMGRIRLAGAGYVPAPVADGPVVTNHDAKFDSSALTGSAGFRNGAERKFALLSTRNPRVLELFNRGDNDLTIEGYYRRSEAIGSEWDIFFMVQGKSSSIHVSYRPGDKFNCWDPSISKALDMPVQGPEWTVGTWVHIAYVRKNRIWSVYRDGELVGSHSAGASVDIGAKTVVFGGRNTYNESEHVWRGDVAELRISRGALRPAQFLCASPEPQYPAAPGESDGTLAFWRLDTKEDGSADLAEAVMPSGCRGFSGTATAQSFGIGRSRRNMDDSGYFADARSLNSGSVAAVTDLVSEGLGTNLGAGDAFTVEGWTRIAEPVTGERKWFGTRSDGTGWELSLLPGAAGMLSARLVAGNSIDTLVDCVFEDVISVATAEDWFNVALAYDPAEGNGKWNLLIEGKSVGEVENILKPQYGNYSAADFSLGAGFGYDVWRVSRGVRSVESLLWRRQYGYIVILR